MIRPSLHNLVPRDAVNLAWLKGFETDASTNLSRLSYYTDKPKNILPTMVGPYLVRVGDSVDPTAGDVVQPSDILLSQRSVVHPDVRAPQPLFYFHDVGRSPLTGVQKFWVKSTAAQATANSDLAKLALIAELKITDQAGVANNAVNWDVEILEQDTSYYRIRIHLDRKAEKGQTIGLRYLAYNPSSGDLFPNHWEVINPLPGINSPELGFVDHSTGQNIDLTKLVVTNPPNALSTSPGIALWANPNATGSVPSVTVTSSDVTVGATGINYPASIKEVAAFLSSVDDNFHATPLSPSPQAYLLNGSYVPTAGGTVINQTGTVHVRYGDETIIEMREFGSAPAEYPWYARFGTGTFRETYRPTGYATDVQYEYSIPEAAQQELTNKWGGREYKEIALEVPRILAKRILKVANPPIYSTQSVKLIVDQRDQTTTWLRDVDLDNGLLYLNSDIGDNLAIEVAYQQKVDFYEYRDLNLNPTLAHNPDIAGKFVGFYLVPSHILGTGVDDTRTECLHHMVADSVEDIKTAVANLGSAGGTDLRPWLLSVVQPIQRTEVEQLRVWDTRSLGGGLRTELHPRSTDQQEAEMYWDIGRWNGIPYHSINVLVLDYPDVLVGTGLPSPVPPFPLPTGWMPPTGELSVEEIQAKADKYADAGALTILNPRTDL